MNSQYRNKITVIFLAGVQRGIKNSKMKQIVLKSRNKRDLTIILIYYVDYCHKCV